MSNKKIRRVFCCQHCGVQAPKWQGRCDSCGTWNSFVEEQVAASADSGAIHERMKKSAAAKPIKIDELDTESLTRLTLPSFEELTEILGGGMVAGAVMLLAGEPGVGKSTLMLQLALGFDKGDVLYISGEESAEQIKIRADRLSEKASSCYVMAETCVEHILQQLAQHEPKLVIIDSIQTLHSLSLEASAGSVAQIRHCTWAVSRYAKEMQVPLFLIGHVTKEGSIAGPKVLEHMVDVVLQFGGERHQLYRALRTSKNRYGPTHNLVLYEMNEKGLKEVVGASAALLSEMHTHSGVAVAMIVEGTRPLLLEVQSLVSTTSYGTGQRVVTGMDLKRLHVLLALLEKRTGMIFGGHDVFVNLAGGVEIEDRGLDLALCLSLVSSLIDKPVPERVGFAAEIGLGGELRPVQQIEARLSEAQHLGLKDVYISAFHKDLSSLKKQRKNTKDAPEIHAFFSLEEVLDALFEKSFLRNSSLRDKGKT